MRRGPGCNRIMLALLGSCLVCTSVTADTQIVSLDGPWREWVSGSSFVEVNVPFSREPVGSLIGYQRIFDLPVQSCDGVALLRFNHIVGESEVYLNGAHLGSGSSFLPFHFDVSDILNRGGPNDLIVTLDDRRDLTTVPYDELSWIHYAGISGAVSLECSDGGVLVHHGLQYELTDNLTRVDGEVAVSVATRAGDAVTLQGAILEGDSGAWTQVAMLSAVTDALADASGLAKGTLTFGFDNPQLWSPDAPVLYKLYLTVFHQGIVVDEALLHIGFRDVRTNGPDILLNGEPILLKGVARHDIYDGTGFVGTEAQMVEDMLRLKQAGVNYVRLLHYPHHPRILELADELGLLVSGEIPAWANFWDADVRDKLYRMLEGMIARDSIHPSIFLWITGNARAHPLPYALEAQQLVHGLDANRLATFVIDNDEYDPEDIEEDVEFFYAAQLDIYMKITWWFYYVEYLQDAWTNFPKDIPLVIAEFGREGNDREPIVVNGDDEFFFGEDQQADAISEMLEAWRPHLPQYNADEHIAGLVLFSYQDFDWPEVTIHLPHHIPSFHTGLVYKDRVEKQALAIVDEFYTNLPDGYVGLPEPDDDNVERRFVNPVALGSTVNAAFRDAGPSANPDGTTVFFSSDGSNNVGLPRIYTTQWDGAVWETPALLDLAVDPDSLAFRRSPCLAYDGQTLYFTRAVLNGIYVADARIWETQFDSGIWSTPTDLGDVVNFSDSARSTSDPTVSADGRTMIFSSDRPGGFGRTDLWQTQRVNGAWTVPQNLGAAVNSEFSDREPSLSFDGKTLYFSSDRSGGMGSSDLWVSHFRRGTGWTTPKNLGPEVNSPGADREPDLSSDGMTLFFTGIRSGGEGLSDLWSATAICEVAGVDLKSSGAISTLATMESCMTRPEAFVAQDSCATSDLDGDGDVDLADVVRFQRCFAPPK